MNDKSQHGMARVRALASRHAADKLAHCLAQAIGRGSNHCVAGETVADTVNLLARAGFVRTQMAQGRSLGEAMRELGKRMRAIPHTLTSEDDDYHQRIVAVSTDKENTP